MRLDLQAPALIFAVPFGFGAAGGKCLEFRLLDLACLVISSSLPLFWERYLFFVTDGCSWFVKQGTVFNLAVSFFFMS